MPISRILGRHRPPGRTEETAMHPTLSYHLAQARTADLRQVIAESGCIAVSSVRLDGRRLPRMRLIGILLPR